VKAALAIRREAELRNVQALLHFTQASNVPSIVTNGLLPRSELISRGLNADASSRFRLDDRDDAVSVSVSAVNWEMFDAKRRKLARQTDWVILALDPSILWTRPCKFYHRSAARKDMKNHRGRLDGPWAFLKMFEDTSPTSRFTGASYRYDTGIPDCLTTSPDAEVQVFGTIPPERIIEGWVARPYTRDFLLAQFSKISDGLDRDILVRDFSPRFSNGYASWG
jgi:hypothetical protein